MIINNLLSSSLKGFRKNIRISYAHKGFGQIFKHTKGLVVNKGFDRKGFDRKGFEAEFMLIHIFIILLLFKCTG